MKIEIGFSPCPNDTFIFDALVHQKIDTAGLEFIPVLADVETLNEWALDKKLPVTKLSYGVYPRVSRYYKIFNSGSALGRGVGPLLISGTPDAGNVNDSLIAIPGENTTANMLFSLAYPHARNKVYLRYDEIESFVLRGKGLGVIIHENRFTYKEKGLHQITDLGDFWESFTGGPIPLGGIVVSNSLPDEISVQTDKLIRNSIRFAYESYPFLNDYIRTNAQEMSDEIMRQHIELYVNDYSLDLGEAGRSAVRKFIGVYNSIHHINDEPEDIFVRPF